MAPSASAIKAQLAQSIAVPPEVAALLALGSVGTPITGDEVKFHQDGETWMTLPVGMTYERAAEILAAKQKEEETVVTFDRQFHFRPDDGANATAEVLKRLYGLTIGKSIQTMFGTRPPVIRTITVGYNKKRQVPWELIEIPALKGAEIYLGSSAHAEYGPVFHVTVQGPKKHKPEVEKLFDAIELELRENSIYRGKALVGADDLDFLDLSKFDPTKLAFSDEVTGTLNHALFGMLKHADAMRDAGIPLKKAFLLYGPFGTGKSSIGTWTAQVAEAHGWTFLMARSGRDKIRDVLRTAKLYQRAVVFIEDIDTQSATSKPQDVSELLEAFDGITAKNSELILVMTTNHIDQIHAGMMRPGRLDYIVEIANLDRGGTERLIRAVIDPSKLAENIDFDAVFNVLDGVEPAFVRAVADRVSTWAISMGDGKPDYIIDTDALIGAAISLKPQLKLLREASEGRPEPAINTAFQELLHGTLDRISVVDSDDGYHRYDLRVEDEVNTASHRS